MAFFDNSLGIAPLTLKKTICNKVGRPKNNERIPSNALLTRKKTFSLAGFLFVLFLLNLCPFMFYVFNAKNGLQFVARSRLVC